MKRRLTDTINMNSTDTKTERSTQALESQYIALLERRIAILERNTAEDTTARSVSHISDGGDENPQIPIKKMENKSQDEISQNVSRDPILSVDKTSTKFLRDDRVAYIETRDEGNGAPPRELRVDESTWFRKRYVDELTILPEPEKHHAFLMKHEYEGNKKIPAESILVTDKKLKKLLSSELQDLPGHWDQEMLRFVSPFSPLVWKYDQLWEVARALDEKYDMATKKDLKILLEKLPQCLSTRGWFDDDTFSNTQCIRFEFLEFIFQPGTLVYATPLDEPQLFVVVGAFKWIDYDETFDLVCWRYDYDGENFRRYRADFSIKEYPSERPVQNLPCFPLEYHKDAAKMKEKLITRGNKCKSINTRNKGHQVFEYKDDMMFNTGFRLNLGNNIFEHAIFASIMNEAVRDAHVSKEQNLSVDRNVGAFESKLYLEGRIVVDAGLYKKYGKSSVTDNSDRKLAEGDSWWACECAKCINNQALQEKLKRHYDGVCADSSGNWPEFEDIQLMTLDPRVSGYALDRKVWGQFRVESIEEISTKNDTTTFDSLVLPSDDDVSSAKSLIRSLVQYHAWDAENALEKDIVRFTDISDGKGRGLVVLLHGAAGVGKTLTAEGVAKITGKPLMKVTVADFGTDIESLEERLDKIFDMASSWRAVLLFDEADVFLEERERRVDLNRNAMVSVLLKALEYFKGILILTTNRVRTIDAAVQSRVNLAIRYPDLRPEERTKIFSLFMRRIPKEEVKDIEGVIDWFSENTEAFNGRQIRNIVSSALALGRAESRKIELKDVKKMCISTKTFRAHLHEQTIRAKERNE